ncbi:MAG TPA: glycosyltransferase [Pyrinomonadaceae bacterium]|jgi:glycosyltransferase involved in cell wall biosynthesis|nr:glycosyltransferase [Pyrinomonadaceae bacterium]
MKILRVIARLNVGGPARHVLWLTKGLKTFGHETLLVTGVVPPGEDDMNYFAEASGITPVTIPQMSREISPKDLLAVWKIYRLMLRERPDIVHTHTAKAGAVGRVAGMMYRWLTPSALIGKPRQCRLVHTYHGHIFHSYYGTSKTKLFLTIERVLARTATDRIVVVSEQQRHEINEQFRVGGSRQFEVIPLGLDLSLFANWQERRAKLREELRASENEVLIGIVGRLTEVKNHQMFLRAAARLKELVASRPIQPRVRFVIIGDGRLRSQLESQARELGLADDVLFLGTRNDPENFYPALDIVALTSLNEGTPLTLIEAMANARPVVATAVGGVVDLLGEPFSKADGYAICQRGISVAREDVDEFARGLLRLIDDKELRAHLAEEGRQFVFENYAIDRLFRDMSKLYERLAAA